MNKNDPVTKLVFELSKLPGIGEKTATRLAYFILKQETSYAQSLAEALLNAKTLTQLCNQCFTFTDITPCRLCSDSRREKNVLCVVERPTDVFSIENTGKYFGLFHVLHGSLSPLDGMGPEDLKIRELLNRISPRNTLENAAGSTTESTGEVEEIILATNPTVEGDATALYLSKLIKPLRIRVTKLAHGIPVGGQLEYTDRQTLFKALENRMEF